MARRSSNPLSDHVQRLEQEQARLMREMAAAEKAMRQKPKVARPQSVPERKVRLNTVAAIDLPRPKDHRFIGGSLPTRQRRKTRRPKTDARLAQIKFLLLCLLLAALVLFVWRNLPG